MALLARLFSPRKTYNKEKHSDPPKQESRPFGFSVDTNNVRVLLFRECDWRGRKLLFDSTSVEKIALDPKVPLARPRSNSSDMVVEVSNGYGYKYKKPPTDTNTLGEMIFGSIAMVTRGSSIKIHAMKDPSRLMFSKIIQAPRSGVRKRQVSDDKTLDDSQSSSVNSMGEFNSGSFGSKSVGSVDDSGFMSLPLSDDWPKHLSPSQHCGCSSCPLHPSTMSLGNDSSSSLQSGGSLSSLRRRWVRSVATSLNLDDPAQPVLPSGKRTKLGISLIIPLSQSNIPEMEQFLLDRLPLVNNILTRLQHSTERAYCRRDVFVQSMHQATQHAIQSVSSLVGGPRLDRPLWLTMTDDRTDSRCKADLEQRLVSDLKHLLAELDTKHTNFFISTLLTAVLTHHLGWVPTAMPDIPLNTEPSLTELSKNHPYNQLWAQLSDLQGALGYPPKIAKTVVLGKSEVLIQQLLSVLSYFIRCGHVKAMDQQREVPPGEENHLEDLLESSLENCSFDKDAIREFSKAGSLDDTESSSSTLTKCKTMLSMKTFSVVDADADNANSIESGFESCNEFSGESYEDGNKIIKSMNSLGSKFGKTKSTANLMETSFSQNTIADGKKLHNGVKMSLDSTESSFIKCIETNHSVFVKVESEKQFTSPLVLDAMNKTNSKLSLKRDNEKSNSFIKENLIQADLRESEDKASKVVFVLGENEELVNIKGQDEANVPEFFTSPSTTSNSLHPTPPIILVNDADAETLNIGEKNEFVSGEVSSRVVVSHSTSIQLEDVCESKTLRPLQRPRCLSAPEEVAIEKNWTKRRRRSKGMIQIIRKWFSDSAIERMSSKPMCALVPSVNTDSKLKVNVYSDAEVFRTSNRSLKDSVVDTKASVENLIDSSYEIPQVIVESSTVSSAEEYLELPFSSSVVDEGRLVSVASSMFGSISEQYSPELVLQGLPRVSPGWLTDLRHSLALEAHSMEDGDREEVVCIVANVDTCEVLLVSSHSVRSEPGVRVGMSQLVANMLETTQHLCALSIPAPVCLSHLETKLQELCVRSQALAELLLSAEFLDMASLTATLDLDANDVPLLLSVASAHTPSVTQKYGLSYQ
ncbi:folliculin-interacting protein 2 [Macrosteles quadrilineatus]|uniref:folliculin-interacting protein 2 n=1 Tax=Macrosteles quadrilineatus TaxID=74068 RepID=UPI0023E1A5F0|nr:folliculin-interacting protein 2 [Macrosteles quadrilineatus]